ncbi:hypothetical protein C7Y71_004050 [Pseudoprevotella muciniphila]|uniref:Uncharacterized protein n=1 Tax=Pseudoprevotella muciniphila TaxID=2133944 RepID=A0A5P8E5Q7_9BACT|nr:hypothetical protein C7Y71_004050 [Pseudoprevotella muciniphila]
MVAQNSIKVNYQGAKPTISDFATAYLKAYVYDENEDVLDESRSYMKSVWMQHLKGERLEATEKLTVDKANGFISLESYDDNDMLLVEMCYWNESDGRHKLFAYNVRYFRNGKYSPGQFDGLTFYRYDNATKTMKYCDAPGFKEVYGTDDGALVSYSLPRAGKNIVQKIWYESGTKEKTLRWNGRKFSK